MISLDKSIKARYYYNSIILNKSTKRKGLLKVKNARVMQLPDIDINEETLSNVNIIDSIEFLSEKENEEIIKSLKQNINDFKNPNKWKTWEESNKILTEKYFGEVI